VAEPVRAIHLDRAALHRYTAKDNLVAVVTDGTAILGLGDLGAEASIPVMEGKAVLFKEFGGIDAFPICIDTQDTEKIIEVCTYLAPTFGGINLEDIAVQENLDEIYIFFAVYWIKKKTDLRDWVELYLPILGTLAVWQKFTQDIIVTNSISS